MKLGVIIVTYNRLELLKECILCCENQSFKFDKICIVNNCSTDGTLEYLSEIKNSLIDVINLEKNLGGSYGFYIGAKYYLDKDIDYVLFIDDDAMISEDYNKVIVNEIKKNNKNIVGYSGTVMCNNQIQYEHRQFLKNNNSAKKINSTHYNYDKENFDYDICSFCGMYVSKKIIEKVGLPEKDYFIWFDDTEYSLRLNRFGKFRNVNSAVLNHKTVLSFNSGYNWKSYYGLRNELDILTKYFPKKTKWKKIIHMLFYVIMGNCISLFKGDRYKKIAGIYYDALIDYKNKKFGLNEKYTYKFKL